MYAECPAKVAVCYLNASQLAVSRLERLVSFKQGILVD